jgi:hypothetical protein
LTDNGSSQHLPKELRDFLIWLYALALLCVAVEWICRKVTSLHLRADVYISPFLNEHYPDFLMYRDHVPYFHSLAFFNAQGPFLYPAPAGIVYQLFYLVPSLALRVFLTFIAAALSAGALFFGRALHRRGLSAPQAYLLPFAVLAASFPVWFEVRQANMEIVMWVLVTSGLVLFLKGRGYTAAACFGIAASMKIYPLAYLGLLLVRRQYRQIACGIGVAVVSTLGSLWLLGGSIGPTWQRVSAGVNEFKFVYILHKRFEIGFDHSLLSILKRLLHPFPAPDRFAPVVAAYLAVVALAGVLLFFLVITKRPVMNQILFLSVACILLPPVSFEYTLLHMLAPLALMALVIVEAARKGQAIPGIRPVLLCFAFLLAPLSELVLHGGRLGGQIKAIVLLILLVFSLTKSFSPSDEASLTPISEGT